MFRGKLKQIILIFTFFILTSLFAASFQVSAAKIQIEVDPSTLLNLDRTWDDVSLLYTRMFHNSSEVQEEIDRFQVLVPELIDMEVIGQTYLGKNITSLKITNELRTQQKAKTLVVAHHHGREQITVEAALRFIIYLLNSYGENETITNFIDSQEIYVIPSLNLDALDVVVDQENYWLRKTVKPWDDDNDGLFDEDQREDINLDGKISSFDVYDNTIPSNPVYLYSYFEGIDNDADGEINEDMIGYADLNRNYDSYWRDGSGWSEDTQSDIYPGPTPFSENETQAFRDFALKHKFGMAYSLHSGINSTFFVDDEDGWAEYELCLKMLEDYDKILPPSFNEIYGYPGIKKSSLAEESAVLAGSWDTWMYFARDTLAPITFEIYNNKSSTALGAETVFSENSTHLILEWTEIYGYFTPDASAIDALWYDVKPGFDYLLDNTPRLSINPQVTSRKTDIGDEVSFSFECTNLSPRIRTIDVVDLFEDDGTHLADGVEILADETNTIKTKTILPVNLEDSEYKVKLGNEFTGYYHFIVSKPERTSGFTVGFSIIGVIVASVGLKIISKRRK